MVSKTRVRRIERVEDAVAQLHSPMGAQLWWQNWEEAAPAGRRHLEQSVLAQVDQERYRGQLPPEVFLG